MKYILEKPREISCAHICYTALFLGFLLVFILINVALLIEIQVLDNFNLEKTASQMLSLFGTFHKHWTAFIDSMQAVGDKIDKAKDEYNKLVTTRRNQLERPLQQIEDLRNQKEISAEQLLDAEIIPVKQPEDTNKTE